MNTFYSAIIAAAVSASIIAPDISAAGPRTFHRSFPTVKATASVSSRQASKRQRLERKAMASSRAKAPASRAEVCGDYQWVYYSYAASEQDYITSTATVFPSEVDQDSVVVVFDQDFGIVAGYDASTGRLSFPSGQYVGNFTVDGAGSIECYFYHTRWHDDDNDFDFLSSDLQAEFDGNGRIEFDPDDNIVFGNRTLAGYFIFAGNNELTLAEDDWTDNMPADGWEFYSNSTLTDVWLLYGFDIDPVTAPYDVVVERNKDIEGLYRIVNPYGESSPLYDFNLNESGKGYIVFSIADPEFVTVYPHVYSGFNDGYDQYLCTNSEGYYTLQGGYTKEEVLAGGVLEGVSNYDSERGLLTICNAGFGTKAEPEGLFFWGGQPNGSLTLPSSAALNSVTAGGNEPVEYYNLQGIRVDHPTAGELLIKRQGASACKVIIVR